MQEKRESPCINGGYDALQRIARAYIGVHFFLHPSPGICLVVPMGIDSLPRHSSTIASPAGFVMPFRASAC